MGGAGSSCATSVLRALAVCDDVCLDGILFSYLFSDGHGTWMGLVRDTM